ncbi:MAG: hypothetical protein WAL29_01675 [Bacteroidales bacterium]
MKKLNICILILVSLFTVIVNGQDITVKSAFDTSRIYIGDQIHYTVTVDQPSGLKLDIPTFKDTLNKNIEILSGPVVDSTVIPGNRTRISRDYLVTSFDSGMYMVKPVYVELRDANGIKRFYSDYSILEVARVRLTPPDTASKIFDIVSPYKAPVTPGELLPWIIMALLAALLVWAIKRYWPLLRKKEKLVPEIVRIEPAHVIAFRELEKLKDEKLWQSGEIKKYYTRLTEILRQYLENRFGVFSLELTTSETLEALVKTGFRKDETYNLIKSVLNGADLVKFAKYIPEPSENELSFENSWNFVSVTKKEELINEPVETVRNKKEVGV